MGIKRKTYTAAEKARISLEALKGTKTINELTKEYGIHASQIKKWKQQLKEGMVEIFGRKRGRKSEEDSQTIDELYKQVGKLTMERDWLKKKSELFK